MAQKQIDSNRFTCRMGCILKTSSWLPCGLMKEPIKSGGTRGLGNPTCRFRNMSQWHNNQYRFRHTGTVKKTTDSKARFGCNGASISACFHEWQAESTRDRGNLGNNKPWSTFPARAPRPRRPARRIRTPHPRK
jgi:hypothetical protein